MMASAMSFEAREENAVNRGIEESSVNDNLQDAYATWLVSSTTVPI